MKKTIDRIASFFEARPALRLLMATLFSTLGVMLAHPQKGMLATLPAALLFFLLAALFSARWFITPCLSAAIALFYAKMGAFADGGALVLFCALTGLLAACALLPLRLGKEKRWTRLLFVALIPALILPMVFWGTPTAFARERNAALAYLDSTYPDQDFTEARFYYSPAEKAWCLAVSYAQNEGELSSELYFSEEEVRDGFREAFAARALEQRKAVLMDELGKSEETDALVDPLRLQTAQGETLHGSYGKADPGLYGKMSFTVTFRKELLTRKELVEAACRAKAVLDEAGIAYGSLRFQAQDAGIPLYAVDVTPAMTDDQILLAAVKL